MRIKVNKKGAFTAYLLVFVVISLISITALSYSFSQKHQKYIGERQLDILDVIEKTKEVRNNIETSSDIILSSSIFELARKGGHARGSPCGTYKGYGLWQNSIDGQLANCFPDDIKMNLQALFNEKLYYHFLNIGLYSPGYDLSFQKQDDGTIFIARAKTKIIFELFQRRLVDVQRPISYDPIIGQMDLPSDPIESPQTNSGIDNIYELGGTCDESSMDLVDITQKISCTSSVPEGCTVLKDVYDKLLEAQKIAREEGYDIHVTSAFRSFETQKDWFENGPPGHRGDPEWMSNPSRVARPSCNSPHTLGRAADILLTDITGNIIPGMEAVNVKNMDAPNRRLLQDIMGRAGFVRYGNCQNLCPLGITDCDAGCTQGEFWHYEYKSPRWVAAKEKEQNTGEKIYAYV